MNTSFKKYINESGNSKDLLTKTVPYIYETIFNLLIDNDTLVGIIKPVGVGEKSKIRDFAPKKHKKATFPYSKPAKSLEPYFFSLGAFTEGNDTSYSFYISKERTEIISRTEQPFLGNNYR